MQNPHLSAAAAKKSCSPARAPLTTTTIWTWGRRQKAIKHVSSLFQLPPLFRSNFDPERAGETEIVREFSLSLSASQRLFAAQTTDGKGQKKWALLTRVRRSAKKKSFLFLLVRRSEGKNSLVSERRSDYFDYTKIGRLNWSLFFLLLLWRCYIQWGLRRHRQPALIEASAEATLQPRPREPERKKHPHSAFTFWTWERQRSQTERKVHGLWKSCTFDWLTCQKISRSFDISYWAYRSGQTNLLQRKLEDPRSPL